MESQEEKNAKNLRGRAKAALTRIITFVNDENQVFNKNDLSNKLKKIDDIYSDFDKADSQLSIENSEMEEFEKKYYETKAKLQDQLEKLSVNITAQSNQLNDQQVNISSSSNVNNNFRLPRVNINSFGGNYKEWMSFKDLYMSLVHENENLSDIQKFQYLKGLLVGEPASIIKHIPISESSYIEAWEKLLSRYDKKKQIVTHLVKTFMEQASVTQVSALNLRKIADTSDEVIRALKSIDSEANNRDLWLIYILLQKVDPKTREEWAICSSKVDFPSFEMFIQFLNDKCTSLELYYENECNSKVNKQSNTHKFSSNNSAKCLLCNDYNHYLFKCHKYKALTVKERNQFVRKNKVCRNCLSNKHPDFKCLSTYLCHYCGNKHHSSLCESSQINNYASGAHQTRNYVPEKKGEKIEQMSNQNENKISSYAHNFQSVSTFALLPTTKVFIYDSFGNKQTFRILIDSASEASFINSSSINLLGLERKNARFPVKGLGNSKIAITKGYTEIELISIYNPDIKMPVKTFVLDNLTAPMPSDKINENYFSHLKNVQLADPEFNITNKIDIILGADYFFSILLPGQITSSQSNLIAQNSIFGFLVSGKLPESDTKFNSITNLHMYEINIDHELKRFWEIEEVFNNSEKLLTPEEEFVEGHFNENFTINSEGRFVVKLPFYESKTKLGDSKHQAISRLLTMERKFKQNPDFEREYKNFMHEYEQLGHMQLVPQNSLNISDTEQCFLPHHSVLKLSSSTCKLRVVFDGSCKTSSGNSLNSILGVGPKLQRDIFEILLNFRFPEIAFSADIEKMYRQILIDEKDQNYQQIFWRSNPEEEIRAYKLKTVTYGLAPASFLATRCIKQIALNCTENSVASNILLNNIYMDDLLSGTSTVASAISLCKEISLILQSHGFNLRKWNCNSDAFRAEFKEHSETDLEIFSKDNEGCKVLGLFWNSFSDTFIFKTSLSLTTPLTKRNILSNSARLFDPLGLISPCTVVLKIFYQKLWLTKGDWDTPVPQHLADDLFKFQKSFNEIGHFSVPRCVTLASDSTFELHGFSDASTFAYAAAIYCRQTHNNKTIVTLLVSKTKVAPIKQISVPRLELCGAHLLSKLFSSVMKILKNYTFDIHAWTDSKVVLSWLSAHPRKWKTFVANRTSQIIEVLPTKIWKHVPSKENPADIASRGIDPKCLPECSLWWNGPSWLQLDSSHWPREESNSKEINDQIKTEQRSDPLFAFHTAPANELFDDLFNKFSSLSKIIRILSYCIRFINNCKNSEVKTSSGNSYTPLTFSEIKYAEQLIIRRIQKNYFHNDIESIIKQGTLPKKSQLHSLHPFIDENGLLRVGGRLQNSQLSFNHKHPIILPHQHKISEYIINEKHITHLHAGPTLLSHLIKQSYWIIGGKKLINKIVNRCIKCYRFKNSTSTPQLMGNLPEHRVQLERPFFACGVDFAGPFAIKFNKGRGSKSTKGYIAIFICLATKAVHIEAVSDLTTDAFLATMRRFISRRGAPRHMHSDNATNFIGAKRKLDDIQKFLLSLSKDEIAAQYLAQTAIEWHFIPPSSPHFGGIWEAAVKSAKFHLKRVVGGTLLTFEEFSTLLTQVEALLNSRPLLVESNDIDSINVLTPAHFITGDVLLSSPNFSSLTTNLKSRWELVQKLRTDFAKAWQRTYLSSLQHRSKWQSPTANIKVGDIVLLREDNQLPGSWPMGRVINVYPGADGLVRVLEIKTKTTILKRNIHKVAVLPLYQA